MNFDSAALGMNRVRGSKLGSSVREVSGVLAAIVAFVVGE